MIHALFCMFIKLQFRVDFKVLGYQHLHKCTMLVFNLCLPGKNSHCPLSTTAAQRPPARGYGLSQHVISGTGDCLGGRHWTQASWSEPHPGIKVHGIKRLPWYWTCWVWAANTISPAGGGRLSTFRENRSRAKRSRGRGDGSRTQTVPAASKPRFDPSSASQDLHSSTLWVKPASYPARWGNKLLYT